MFQSIKTSLMNWNDSTTDREKLQHAYIAVAGALLIVAGIFGLLNQTLGQQILTGAIAAAVIFLINAVAWALLQSLILLRVTADEVTQPKEPTTKKTKTAKK